MDNNRQIKFRAWDNEAKCFRYFQIGAPWTDFQQDVYDRLCLNGVKFEMFSSLTDKEGKEIYEGDLLTRDLGVKWKVEFTERGWRAVSFPNHTGLYLDPEQFVECKIVGTIHQ